jgi:hypothetical protein
MPRPWAVPQDEQCFVVFQATSAHTLAETIQRAGIAYERITEVIDLTSTGGKL